jgi:phage terminase small subunit
MEQSYLGFIGMSEENRFDQYAQMRLKAIDWFMRGYSKAESMRKAGYSESVCKTDTSSVFGRDDVKEEIARRQDKAAQKAQVDANWIIGRLTAIAGADVGDLIDIDASGVPTINFNRLTPEIRSAIGEVGTRNGELKVKTADKLRALELLGKYLGLFQDRIKIEGDQDLIDRLYAGRKRVGEAEDEV